MADGFIPGYFSLALAGAQTRRDDDRQLPRPGRAVMPS
jgi:hypothetical protein